MIFDILFIFVIIIIKNLINFPAYSTAEKIRFLKVEHTGYTYLNPEYINYLNHTARRLSRRDPVYYYDLHFDARVPLDNKIYADFYFYEWLTNQYKPTFVEMHFKWCDLIHKDQFFGAAMKQGELAKPCPRPPGVYHLYNMTVPGAVIPTSFPFTKGRIICNLTYFMGTGKTKDWMAEIYVNMEIKTANKKTTSDSS